MSLLSLAEQVADLVDDWQRQNPGADKAEISQTEGVLVWEVVPTRTVELLALILEDDTLLYEPLHCLPKTAYEALHDTVRTRVNHLYNMLPPREGTYA